MASADVVVTTSGQTCHEARVVGRPLVIMDAVAGHGRKNLLLEITKGGALACTPHPRAVVHAVQAALEGVCPPADPWPLSSQELTSSDLRGAHVQSDGLISRGVSSRGVGKPDRWLSGPTIRQEQAHGRSTHDHNVHH
jgi:hypothetical protein